MKKISMIVENDNKSLLEMLRERGYDCPAYCGGRGTCGKCRVRFLQDAPETDDRERSILSDQEIAEGWRLACRTLVRGDIEFEIEEYREQEMEATDDDLPSACALAVDLGTTTIAASLVDPEHQEVVRTLTTINHQRAYGADVLSRIQSANHGEGKALRDLVIKDLNGLCQRLGIGDQVEKLFMPVIISGNTTMEHLLQGFSCRGLGAYPYTPVDISLHTYKNMTILPGISSYVGADIVSGIVACGMDQKEEVSILVDLGTNGEMVIGNRHRILVASAAAGPAFEGGNIQCGMAGVPGAIDRVEIRDDRARVTTIGGGKARGICGSGVLETVYELVKEGLVDETGLLDDAYFEEGYPLSEGITFTAKDIREVQLAKAAIRAGIEILADSYGLSWDQVDRLYLAGGFGQKINSRKAVEIGMLPRELSGKIIAVGNSSLEGARMLAMNPDLEKRFLHIPEISREIILSNHKLFYEWYIDYMNFDC